MLVHRAASTLGLGLIATLAIGCGGDGGGKESSAPETIPQPSQAQLEAAGLDTLRLAPESDRIDIEAPTFSNPTEITNPLFPISELQSTIFSGVVEDKPFHTEATLLPETKMIEWSPGQWVEARVSQYFAYIGGRIEEVATDYYAQADDGSVWYLGEDVFDYDEHGFNDSSLGSWLAGRDGPPQMIMPADPQVGDVHRAENIPAIAFEEVEIKQVGKAVPGPPGPVDGAMVARELHDDGTYSDKVFAPRYGEFYTAHGGEVEAMALAVPTDALDEPMPAELEEISAVAEEAFAAVSSRGWPAASEAQRSAAAAWRAYRSDNQIPLRLGREMERALRNLGAGIDSRRQEDAGNGAIDVSQSALDFQLRYRPQADIDLDRFEVWARQITVHDAAGDLGGVRGDVATMEWIRDRFADALDATQLTAIDNSLVVMREALLDGEPTTTVKEAVRLRSTLAGIGSADPATASG